MQTIEHLARTIAKAKHGTDAMWANYMGAAEAVVETLRDPTPTMIAAAWRVIDRDKKAAGIAKLGPGPGAAEWWRAMIEEWKK